VWEGAQCPDLRVYEPKKKGARGAAATYKLKDVLSFKSSKKG
jgi:hypothetical protein